MSRSVRSAALIAAILVAFTTSIVGAPRELPADPIDRELLRIRGMLRNAETKLSNDVGGLGTTSYSMCGLR